jgi:hypothetical protein
MMAARLLSSAVMEAKPQTAAELSLSQRMAGMQ